jgi:VanZ family protein
VRVQKVLLALRHRGLWIALSVVLLAVVAWGSLQTSVRPPIPRGFDKVEHYSTYVFLAFWFTGLVHRSRYWWVGIALVGFGVLMEAGQLLMRAGRVAEPYDIAANVAGVATGLLLGFLLTGGWAQKIEAWLRR